MTSATAERLLILRSPHCIHPKIWKSLFRAYDATDMEILFSSIMTTWILRLLFMRYDNSNCA